ncbi:hypothetical protein N9F50_00990 [Akkermansiaceae bacterium]|nr:hypothetical protein [Akkermansiaceae bacterium]
MIASDDPYPARSILLVTKEDIPIHNATVTMTESERPLATIEVIVPIDILAGFIGDDLALAVTPFKKVLFYDRPVVELGGFTNSDANRLSPVLA